MIKAHHFSFFLVVLGLSLLVLVPSLVLADTQVPTENVAPSDQGTNEEGVENLGEAHHDPATWSVIPFVLLLVMIATGPLFYAHFWHKFYPMVAVTLGIMVVGYYVFWLGDVHHPIHSMAEFISFIALISALFVASGGILIKVEKEGTPLTNVLLLLLGAVIANVIGTTGASILLIRPFIRLNKNRIKAYHVVFFIFIVSNVGGSLTPIGDPPLFLGFLKGVPFFWTVGNMVLPWLFGICSLAAIFFFIDRKNHADYDGPNVEETHSGKITIQGTKNIGWLAVVIGAVFIDPAVIPWVPGIEYDGVTFSFVRELIMFTTAVLAYKFANEECLRGNEFNFEPIREVGFLFVGIFATMMPALQLIGAFANSPEGFYLVSTNTLYWATGFLSGVLDNAPTYLNFLAAGMGKFDLDINMKEEVLYFSHHYEIILKAISVAAVFFGAMTYIGNAPNFMVKSIAEQVGIQMPAFMGYVIKYSIPILLPVLLATWLIFFAFAETRW